MKNIFKNHIAVILIVIVVALGIIIGIINALDVKITFFESAVNAVVTPVQKVITSTGKGVSNFFGYFSDVDAIRGENKKLKEENEKLLADIKLIEAAEKENEELRGMLGLKSSAKEYELECAEIIARDPENWFSTITVDKGTANGVSLDQVVIASNKALVGRVCEIGSDWAKIVLITDPECSVGAELDRSGEFCVTEGDAILAEEGKVKLSYISKNANIIVGDSVLTSGLGSIFPKGLLLGSVQNIQTDVQGISQYVVLTPACDLNTIEKVFIIKSEN